MAIGFKVLDEVVDLVRKEGEEWQAALKDYAKKREAEKQRIIEQEKKFRNKKKIGFEF